jgi:hypothetical protein
MATTTEEKVELSEQTPLTPEAGAAESTTEAGGQPAEAAKKEKKWWFKKVG